jgi:hypothetical protein
MPSGGKTMTINTLERALSVDINRLQLFLANDRAEMMRQLLDVGLGNDDFDASGVNTQGSLGASPMVGEILNGLLVTPGLTASGTGLDISIGAGVAFILPASDSDPDSSNYKYVRDPGLATGTIFMSANASGSTRIDVIECSYTLNASAETDNRDIFNPATGTFTATAVSKASQANLTYRVRQGTPGSGFPGTAAGWMPLVVASVPTGTTGNDTIDFWDVRPMISDRVKQPFNAGRMVPQWGGIYGTLDLTVVGGHAIMQGTCEVSAVDNVNGVSGKYRLGGMWRRGTPGKDVNVGANPIDGVDLTDSGNLCASIVGATAPGYVYLCEPLGLPRWARYTDSNDPAPSGAPYGSTYSGRRPRSPRGILCVSAQAPQHFYGGPAVAFPLPTGTLNGASVTKAVCIGVVSYVAGAPSQGTVWDGKTQWAPSTAAPFLGVQGTAVGTVATYALQDGVTHPAHAKALYVQVQTLFGGGSTAGAILTATIFLKDTGGTTTFVEVAADQLGGIVSNSAFVFSKIYRVPWAGKFPYNAIAATVTRNLVASYTSPGTLTNITTGAATIASVIGWDLF